MSDPINVKGLSDLQKLLDELPAKMERNIMRGALRAGMNEVKPAAVRRIHSRTGQLAAGLKISSRARGGVVSASLRATGPHAFIAHMLEFTGAAAHWIKPSKAGALVIGKSGQIREVVYHPGFLAMPFMRPALDEKAADAVVATGNYIKQRLKDKNGLDTSDISIGVGT